MSYEIELVKFKDVIDGYISEIIKSESENLNRAAEECVASILKGGLIYIFGSGHSMLMALELFYRAGGLAYIYPILDVNLLGLNGSALSSSLEKSPGYAKILLNSVDLIPNSVFIIVSRSGVNNVPVEMAYEAKQRGAKVIAITSVNYSKKLTPNNSLNKRLYEIADIVIDDKVPEGEAGYELDGYKISAISTILDTFILHSLEILIVKKLLEKGVKPDIWMSAHIPGSHEHNRLLREKYKKLIKYL